MTQITLYKASDFESLIEPVKQKALKIVDEKVFIKEAGFALQAINANSELMKATKESIMQAVYNTALTGLSLNPVLKYAYLIPRWSNGAVKCTLDPSYQGLVKLLTDTGSVKSIYCHPVYKGDVFEVTLGTATEIKHSPKYSSRDIEKVYAVGILSDGSKQIEVMTKEEIDAIRDISESYKAFKAGKIKSCIWESNYSEMARKTVIKRISKYLPKTEKWDHFAQAVHLDNQDYMIGESHRSYLNSLIEKSTYDEDTKQVLLSKLYSELSTSEAETMKNDLLQNQRDPIASGDNYSQTDIKKKMDTLA